MRIIDPFILGDKTLMIMEWDTTKTAIADTASNQIALPLVASQVIDITVNWGDGNIESFTDSDDLGLIHTYTTSGIYTVTIKRNNGIGGIGFSFNHAPLGRRDRTKILNIKQFGDIEISQDGTSGGQRMFFQCNNLDITATDIEERAISTTTGFTDFFRLATSMSTFFNIENWDITHANTLTGMFANIPSFNEDISSWDVGTITSFSTLFSGCTSFNQNLASWNVSAGTLFTSMFASCGSLNFSVASWNMNAATSIGAMFTQCTSFVGTGLGNWNTTGITNMSNTFANCDSLDTDGIELWDTGDVTTFFRMFLSNGSTKLASADLTAWDLSSATNLSDMFGVSSFNGDISGWTLRSTVGVNCSLMFRSTSFNGTVNDWTNTSSITNTSQMFSGCGSFNQPVNNWDMSNCTNMFAMFDSCTNFNSAIFTNTSSLTGSLQSCFRNCTNFNQDISGWTITNVTNMSSIFVNCVNFNQNISSWDVSGVTNFRAVFDGASVFSQDLSSWDISSATDMEFFGRGANFTTAQWDAMLVAWEGLTTPPSNITIHMNASYTETSVDSGTTDSTTADKLVESGQNFLTTVSIGDIVHNTTDDTYAEVTAIDSDTQLSLDNDIMVSGENYTIQSSNAAKARYSLLNTYSWTINDGGPV